MNNPAADHDLPAWLALSHTSGLGPVRIGQLLERFGSPRQVLAQDTACLAACGLPEVVRSALAQPDWRAVEQSLRWAEGGDRHILTLDDPRYPSRLREIPAPPPVLYVEGDPAALQAPQIAMVGSRNPSPGGRDNARTFARELARQGLVVTSGLALGIDAASHEGALETGRTLAVTGSGPDQIYPRRHLGLARRIVERGALVTEFAPGTPPLAEHFPRRNRIISGLSLGVLVVEAAPQSGSLITARYALEQGREVCAIPGSIHNPLARGCHALIRQGAKLVETVTDILEELPPPAQAWMPPRPADTTAPAPDLDSNTLIVMQNIGDDPVAVDTLLERTGLTADRVSSILLVLELQGWVTTTAGGRYQRLKEPSR